MDCKIICIIYYVNFIPIMRRVNVLKSKSFLKDYLNKLIQLYSTNPTHLIQFSMYVSMQAGFDIQPISLDNLNDVNLYNFINDITTNKISRYVFVDYVSFHIIQKDNQLIDFTQLNKHIEQITITKQYLILHIKTVNIFKIMIVLEHSAEHNISQTFINAMNDLTHIKIRIENPNFVDDFQLNTLKCTSYDNKNSLHVSFKLRYKSPVFDLSFFGNSVNELVLYEECYNSSLIGQLPELESIIIYNLPHNVDEFFDNNKTVTKLSIYSNACCNKMIKIIMNNQNISSLTLDRCRMNYFKDIIENNTALHFLHINSILHYNLYSLDINQIQDNFKYIHVENTLPLNYNSLIAIAKSRCLYINFRGFVEINDVIQCIKIHNYNLPLAQLTNQMRPKTDLFEKYYKSTINKYITLNGLLSSDCNLMNKYDY